MIAVNNTGDWTSFRIFVRDAGAKEKERYICRLQTLQEGHGTNDEDWGEVTDGYLTFDLPPFSSAVLSNAEN